MSKWLDLTPATRVRVILSLTGRERLRAVYVRLFAAAPGAPPYAEPDEDEQGFSSVDIATVAQAFGKDLFSDFVPNPFYGRLQVEIPEEPAAPEFPFTKADDAPPADDEPAPAPPAAPKPEPTPPPRRGRRAGAT